MKNEKIYLIGILSQMFESSPLLITSCLFGGFKYVCINHWLLTLHASHASGFRFVAYVSDSFQSDLGRNYNVDCPQYITGMYALILPKWPQKVNNFFFSTFTKHNLLKILSHVLSRWLFLIFIFLFQEHEMWIII